MKLTKGGTPTPTLYKPEIERLFDRFFGPLGFELPEMKVFETVWAPSVDLTETDKEFVVRLEVPGVHKENLDVNLDANVLTISGNREFRKDEETEQYIWKEREEGKFVRSLRMPKPVQEGKVEAMYENGVLTVRLLKTEPTVKTRIAIK
jgi:HSP20 family protein